MRTCTFGVRVVNMFSTGWRRPKGCLILIRHFLQKSPIISGFFVKKNELQLNPMSLRHPVVLGSQYVCIYILAAKFPSFQAEETIQQVHISRAFWIGFGPGN